MILRHFPQAASCIVYGEPKAVRFVRWRKAGISDRMMDAITTAYDGDIQMIGSTSIRAHHDKVADSMRLWLRAYESTA